MEDAKRESLDPLAPGQATGDRAVELHDLSEEMNFSQDERIVSTSTSQNAVVTGASRNTKDQPVTSITSGLSTLQPFNTYTPQEQGYYIAGYENGSVNWDEHSNYVNANNLNAIPPVMYNDTSSLFFPPGYGFDSQMAYGQFPPLANPLSPIMIEGQVFSPHQVPVTLPYYQPPISPGPPHQQTVTSASQTVTSSNSSQENLIDSAFLGPGSASAYYVPFGSFSGGEFSGSSGHGGPYKYPGEFGPSEPLARCSSAVDTSWFMSPLTSGTGYPQPIGMLGSYEQNVAQAPFQSFGLTTNSSARHLAHRGSYQSTFGSSYNRYRFPNDKSGRHERDQNAFNISTDTSGLSSDRNRGPRALKPKSTSSPEEESSVSIQDSESTSRIRANHFNSPDFVTDFELAKFFVIKSFSEDNIHKSVKYGVWASTPLGNRKLDAAYRESKETEGICPVFLFFSVNASGQFCGLAEMIGPVDFETDADYWQQQDRWSGQFPVKWHIIKDVPNSRFRHILLKNNDNKPVTHSRDSQEVKLEQGTEMLKIFKEHDPDTSLLDDFEFYDERERTFLESKAKQGAAGSGVKTTGDTSAAQVADSVSQLSANLSDTLRLDGLESKTSGAE